MDGLTDKHTLLFLLVLGTFGADLAKNYEFLIADFRKKFEICQEFCEEVHGYNLSISWKLHVLVAHLGQFLSLSKTGMAIFAEQCIESAHSDF